MQKFSRLLGVGKLTTVSKSLDSFGIALPPLLPGKTLQMQRQTFGWMIKIMNRDMTKPTEWVCTQQRLRKSVHPAKTQISLDQPWHPPSLIRVFAVHMKKPCVLSYPLSAQRRLRSDLADAQTDLSLRWAHTHFVGFVMSWLKCCSKE